MCGIFGYVGGVDVKKKLLEGLKFLEYRGYDSAGILAVKKNGEYYLQKSVGKVSSLANKVKDLGGDYHSGIAHTRRATHGGVTEENSHPHYSNSKRFFLVHNGIIENYLEIKKKLEQKGYKFYSQTDSEVIANLLEAEFEKDLLTTVKKITKILQGAYALGIIDTANPQQIVGVKLGSPLVVGLGKDGNYIASDPNALRKFCNTFFPLSDREIVVISESGYEVYDFNFTALDKQQIQFDDYDISADKGEFKHFMLKEIFEIPQIFLNAIAGRINFVKKEITSIGLSKLVKKDFKKIEIIASGTSYNAGLTASYRFENFANMSTSVYISSEYKYKKHFIDDKTLYIFISQSGETADTLESLKIVKAKGGFTFGVVNVVASSIAQLTDMGLYTHSGVEVGVASTKAFIGQLAVLLLMSLKFGLKNGMDFALYEKIIDGIKNLSVKFEEVLTKAEVIKAVSKKYMNYKNMFFLGRNFLYPIAMEGSLKLKEISYLHSEAYSAGELKHGPLSLIDENFPSVLLNPQTYLYEKNIYTLKEVQARNGKVLGIVTKGDENLDLYDDVIEIPEVNEYLSPFLVATVLDLFAYYIADFLGREIDKPRNLAKSVTVE